MNGRGKSQPCLLLEFVGSRCREIAPIYGQRGIIAREGDSIARKDFDADFIGKRDRHNDCLDLVKTVRATAKNSQLQVDFGWSAHLHGRRIL